MQDQSCLTSPHLIISCKERIARLDNLALPCRIGRGGFIDGVKGAEGDEKTPLGLYHLRFGFYRADRLPTPPLNPKNPLTWHALNPDDGWCDDISDAAYNRFVKLPYRASHEALWREDGAYDIVLVMSHNDSPPQIGKGSAVFIHVAQPDNRKTLGCIAFAPEEMTQLLPQLKAGLRVDIQP